MPSIIPEQAAFLLDYGKLIIYAREQNVLCTAGELWRPDQMQKIYIQTGRSKTMVNRHGQRVAGDLNFFDAITFKSIPFYVEKDILNPVLEKLGKYWEELSPKNRAGMFWKSFKDVPHFERRI